MTYRQIFKEIMTNKKITLSALASRIGISVPAVYDRIGDNGKAKDVTVNKLVEMARLMDYKVVIIPREARVPADGYVVDQDQR